MESEKKCPYCAETIKAEAILCRFCSSDLTDKPKADSNKSTKENTVDDKGMSTLSTIMIFVLVGAGALLVWGFSLSNTPDGKERGRQRDAIDVCWKEYGRKSAAQSEKLFIAGACEKMQNDFKARWGRNP